ncbi:MAG: DNA-formamidopyrimidine glycosylase family protein [Myxococcota bacterium]|nr:DNA-formamidopyrimidine glycosylase family protein [Myxococcota bacterium]
MPEGDTLHKLARYLSPRLRGQVLEPIEVPNAPRALVVDDDEVEEVFARGKHLLIQLGSGRCLRVHLGMNGTFHHYRHHVRWKRSPRTAQVVLATRESVFVCFRPTKVELSWSTPPPTVRALGPDLALGPPDPARLAERLRTAHERSPRIDDILLDQQICSGIGNVYKSEILFIGQISPDRAVETLSEEKVRELFEVGSQLLRDNLEGGPRVTTASGHLKLNPYGSNLWVYGRRNQPCFRCQTPISRAITGRQTRVTYWCPQCQE